MSIGYVRTKRMISVGANPGQKYLAIINRNGNVSIDTLTKQISQATTISEPDVLACLKAFEIFIGEHVLNGMAVKMNYLGSFIPAIKSKACDNLEDVTVSSIEKAKCRFYPSPFFMNDLKTKSSFVLKNLDVKGYQK